MCQVREVVSQDLQPPTCSGTEETNCVQDANRAPAQSKAAASALSDTNAAVWAFGEVGSIVSV